MRGIIGRAKSCCDCPPEKDCPCPEGPQGPQGARGPQGAQGPQGPQGGQGVDASIERFSGLVPAFAGAVQVSLSDPGIIVPSNVPYPLERPTTFDGIAANLAAVVPPGSTLTAELSYRVDGMGPPIGTGLLVRYLEGETGVRFGAGGPVTIMAGDTYEMIVRTTVSTNASPISVTVRVV